MAIFDKNHGLTRLENFDFFDFFKTSFFMSTKHSTVWAGMGLSSFCSHGEGVGLLFKDMYGVV